MGGGGFFSSQGGISPIRMFVGDVVLGVCEGAVHVEAADEGEGVWKWGVVGAAGGAWGGADGLLEVLLLDVAFF